MPRNTLNARQEAFCRGLAEGKSQSQAYVDVGYAARAIQPRPTPLSS